MSNNSFQALYRNVFARLGHPLTKRDGASSLSIAASEKKLGIKLPLALRQYYLVAGRERKLNHAHNHLLTPPEWELDSRKLVFMEENQGVVVWGVSTVSPTANNPMVFQGPIVDGEPDKWFRECKTCSGFLIFMLHLQAAFGGGMKCSASAPAPPDLVKSLRRDWHFAGEVNKMRAYSRQGQAVCVVKWRDLLDGAEIWRVFAGACSKMEMDTLANDLHLMWD